MKQTKEKRTWRFTALDFIILFTVLAAVGAAIYFFGPFGNSSGEDSAAADIEFTVEFKNVDEKYVGNIKVGDVVVDSVTKRQIGVVSAVEHTAMTEYVINTEDGVIEEKEYPGQVSILVTVHSTASRDARGYYVDGYRIAIGVQHYLQLPAYVGSGFCIGIEEVKN